MIIHRKKIKRDLIRIEKQEEEEELEQFDIEQAPELDQAHELLPQIPDDVNEYVEQGNDIIPYEVDHLVEIHHSQW